MQYAGMEERIEQTGKQPASMTDANGFVVYNLNQR